MEAERLVDSGIAPSEALLPSCNPETLTSEQRFDRRLYGISLILTDLADRFGALGGVVIFGPGPATDLDYAARKGQYVGLIKGFCFQRGLPVTLVGESEVYRILLEDPDGSYAELESEMNRRYPNLPTQQIAYDNGTVHLASPGGAVAVALAARSREWGA